MKAARERVAAGDLDGAVKVLTDYVAAHPQEPDAERLLGDLYYRHGDLEHAQAVYEHILSYAPHDKETHSRLGSVLATENHVDAAIEEFNRSLPGTDSVPDLVRLHLRKGDFPEYQKEREEMVRDYPGDTEALLELAQLYEAINQSDHAMQLFQRVLDNDSRSVMALNGLGLSLEDEHADAPAITELKLCVLYDPYNYPCWTNLGGAYWDLHEYIDAEKTLDVAHGLEPEHPEALVNLGNVADSNGDWKRAVAYYVQAMTVDPFAPDAYINLGITYDQHQQYQLAQSALVKGLAVAPEDARLHYVLGEVYRKLGETQNAQVQYREAADQNIYPDYRDLAREELTALGHDPAPLAKP